MKDIQLSEIFKNQGLFQTTLPYSRVAMHDGYRFVQGGSEDIQFSECGIKTVAVT